MKMAEGILHGSFWALLYFDNMIKFAVCYYRNLVIIQSHENLMKTVCLQRLFA